LTSDNFTPLDWINAMLRPRAFALADAPPDPELLALLRLGEAAVAANSRLAVELSAITTPRVRTLFQGETNFRAASGLRFTVDGSDIFAATLAAGYLPESRDFEAFMQLVRSGGCVVDVGANFGLYGLSAAIYARPRGRVFAFEPAPGAFAMLQRNIADNDLAANVTATQAAVGAAPGRAQFHIGKDVSFSSLHRTQRIDDGASAVDVEVVSLDTALAQVSTIDLLKIDVEGGEADVLRGGRELLKRSPGAIVQFEYSHKNIDATRRQAFADIIALFAQDGFRLYRHGADGPVSLPAPQDAFSGNLFLTRQGQSEARLRRALQAARPIAQSTYELGGLALLQRVAEQSEALKRTEVLQREVIEVADAVVGDGVVEGGTEAVRAVQRAWLDARKRVREAEGKANALSASVEGRNNVIEQNAEKIGHLRSAVLALEASTDRLREERERLIAKTAAQRDSIAQLQKSLEESRKQTADVAERLTQKSAIWREADGKMRERIAGLEASLKTSNGKLQAVRKANEELRQRLTDMMAQAKDSERELSRVRNVAKRMVQRYEELRARAGGEADAEGSSVD
jgi:FkbM family methyltransferase